jgi:iron complex outermembrane recepter protein
MKIHYLSVIALILAIFTPVTHATPFAGAHENSNFSDNYLKTIETITRVDTIILDEFHLEEVTVRSPKEPAKINELPASISLISFERSEYKNTGSLKDLSSIVPNFFMPDYGSKLTSPVYIRGIGSRINTPSIGLYVDNVPYFEKSSFDFDFFEIDRIEVLRGPQGTLYGRNTMGGIINIFTRSPLDYQGTRLNITGGNYMNLETSLSHYNRLSGNTAFSVSGNYKNHDGFFINHYTGEKADNLSSLGGRLRFVHEIGDRTKAEFTSNYERSRQGGYPYALYNMDTYMPEKVNYNRYSSYDRDMITNSVHIDHRRDNFKISSTTSYQYTSDLQSIDQDFTPGDLFFVTQDENQRMFSQEIIAGSDNESRYHWLFGSFGFIQSVDRKLDIKYGEDFLMAQNIPFNMTDNRLYDHGSSGGAVFHQSRLSGVFTKNLVLTAGIRLDYEKSTLTYKATRYMGSDPVPAGDFISSMDFFEIMPKFAAQYNSANGHSAYVTVSRGYKTGGFNVTFESDEDRSFDPEFSWNYEAGIKSAMFMNRAFVNASVFLIDWTNQQIYQPVPSGQGAMLKNAGESVSQGFELEIRARPHKNLETQVAYGYTKAIFTDHLSGPDIDYSGNYIPYVPRQTMNTGIKYSTFPGIEFVDELILHTNFQVIGKHYWNEENTQHQDSYGIININLSIVRKSMQLDLWGKNITNNQYHSFFFEAIGNSYVQMSRPLRFGATLGVNL